MQILIASDIFGRTTELETLAEQLAPHSSKPLIVDPYKGAFRHFSGEPEAYATFQGEVGLGCYIQSVRRRSIRGGSISICLITAWGAINS